MARKVLVTLADDLDDGLEADETVEFGLDGAKYEIDLAEENASELRTTLRKYIGSARKVTRASANANGGRRSPARSTSDREETRQAREWLVANGFLSKESRGRISAENWERYRNR